VPRNVPRLATLASCVACQLFRLIWSEIRNDLMYVPGTPLNSENTSNDSKYAKYCMKEFLEGFVTKIGAYVMFCYLNSWELISDKNTHQQNKELRDNWVEKAASLKEMIGNFDGFMAHSYYLKNKKKLDTMTNQERNKLLLEFNSKQAKKLEKLLLKKIPEMQQVEDVWKNMKADDWKSINYNLVTGTVSFRKESRKSMTDQT